MSFIITILAALLVFSAVIAIHEFGHFTVAKLCGIQVNEFSIGMGPVLWKKNHKGTQYSLRAMWRWRARKAPKASRQKLSILCRSSPPRRRKHLCSQPASL